VNLVVEEGSELVSYLLVRTIKAVDPVADPLVRSITLVSEPAS